MNAICGEHRSPGQFLNALLLERGWTKRTLAVVLGIDEQKVNRLASDKQPLTAELALLLEEAFGVDADLFLNKQKAYELAVARIAIRPDETRALRANLYTSLPVSEMIRRGWIRATDLRDPAVEGSLARFFGANRLEDIEALPHAAKKTKASIPISPTQLAWLYRTKAIAREMHPNHYKRDKLTKAIEQFKELRSEAMDVRHIPQLLNETGVRFVVVEGLPGGQIDGVCFWLDSHSPVIGMSLRFDRIDNFWFVLRHECAHILHGHGKTTAIIDDDLSRSNDDLPEEERIANAEAADFCVPQDKLKSFFMRKNPFFTKTDILSFAKRMGVHPGIAAGQLHRISSHYEIHREFLVKIRENLAGSMLMDGWGDVVPVVS